MIVFFYAVCMISCYILFANKWIVKDFKDGKVVLYDKCTPTEAALIAIAAALFPIALLALAVGSAAELIRKWKRSRQKQQQ